MQDCLFQKRATTRSSSQQGQLIVYTHHMNVQLKGIQPYQFYLWIYEHLQ